MAWDKDQINCIRHIYSEILNQPNQLKDDLTPIEGSRLYVFHKNAHNRATGKVGVEHDNLVGLFGSIDPQFTELFNEVQRIELFDALGFIVYEANAQAAAPYLLPATGLIY